MVVHVVSRTDLTVVHADESEVGRVRELKEVKLAVEAKTHAHRLELATNE